MALSATIQKFSIAVSDVDRQVYTTIETRLAQHPSESDAYLVTRALAFALEHREGLEMGRGVSSPDEATIWAPGEHQSIALWIEVGLPVADRLTRITKQADEVCIYAHKNIDVQLPDLINAKVHGADRVRIVPMPADFLKALAETLARQNQWEVVRSGGILYLTANGTQLQTEIHELRLT